MIRSVVSASASRWARNGFRRLSGAFLYRDLHRSWPFPGSLDGAAVKAFEGAVADAVRIGLEAAGEKEALAKLEEIARQMLG